MNERFQPVIFREHTYPYRVFYADTDAGGVVYYAQYLRMFEQVRALYIEEYGITLREMVKQDCQFVCRKAELDYLSPARLDDILDIHVWISEMGKTFFTFAYEIFCTNRVSEANQPIKIVNGITKMVCCKTRNDTILPQRIPQWILDNLSQKPAKGL